MMVPPVHTAAFRAYRRGEHRRRLAALRPAPADRVETVLTLWKTALFDTIEISARTGLDEATVDRIIASDMEARHG